MKKLISIISVLVLSFTFVTSVSAQVAPTCTDITLQSSTSTQFVGLTTTDPAGSSLDSVFPLGTPGAAVLTGPDGFPGAWNTALADSNLSGAIWVNNISTAPSNPAGIGTGQDGTIDTWRLFSESFTIPSNAITISNPVLYFTSDNSVQAFLDGASVGNASSYTTVAASSPQTFTAGTHTFKFVTKNDAYSGATNPTALIYKVVVNYCVPGDTDNDGVSDDVDYCPNTQSDGELTGNTKFSQPWGVHRWHYNETEFIQQPNKNGNGTQDPKSIGYTYGCSCKQILDILKDEGLGEFGGHYKFGCSTSILEDFHNNMSDGNPSGKYFVETVNVPANNPQATSSVYSLVNGINYSLNTRGTATACWQSGCHITFDPEHSASDYPSFATWVDGVAAPYTSYGLDLLDLKVNGNFVDWGTYNPLHTYQLPFVGVGSAINFVVYDLAGSYGNDAGNLYVDIYAEL